MIKRVLSLFAMLAVVLCLISCSYNGSYDEGYSEGYDEGYFDALDVMQYELELEYEYGYEKGYSNGYEECMEYGWLENIDKFGNYFGREAEHYASRASEWHPEEAWVIIEAYRTGSYVDFCGSVPSWQDYQDAVDSLICFYDYFYGSVYEQ